MARQAALRRAPAVTLWTWVQVLCVMAAVAAAESWDMDGDTDDQDDFNDPDCSKSIRTLAACVPYVTGQAASPPPECCAGTLKVYRQNPRCLCIVMQSTADTSNEIRVNATLALRVPILCRVHVNNVTTCSSILALPPGAPDRQFFDRINTTAPASQPPEPTMGVSVGRRLECFSWGRVAAMAVSVAWAALR